MGNGRFHKVLNDVSLISTYLQLMAEGLRDIEAGTPAGNLRLTVLRERARDLSNAVKRLVDDVRAIADEIQREDGQ